MFVTPLCLISAIWAIVACDDTYQSDLTKLTPSVVQLYGHTRKTISLLYISGTEFRNDLAIHDVIFFNCILIYFTDGCVASHYAAVFVSPSVSANT